MTTFNSEEESRLPPHEARAGTDSLRALPFPDSRSAGRELASKLSGYAGREDVIVLALASGGVPVATEVATRLGLPLDVVIIRRLLAPSGVCDVICALSVAGTLFLDEGLAPRKDAPSTGLDFFIADALDELARRERECRGASPPVALAGKTVLLVDNGVRTGSTVRAALRALRASGPARIVVAVPVAAPESREEVGSLADEFVCLAFPHPFGHVGLWYRDFERASDAQIRQMLEQVARGRRVGEDKL